MEYDIYSDIAKRTDGDIYIGVVGPVRTGKSTFITKFMQEFVLPNMAEGKKSVAVDEMPQSAAGKTVMTTEPKFVPSQAVTINVGNKTARIRLIDCVGYMVNGALGGDEDGKTRLVKTPWQDSPMPFDMAAEVGTLKVIKDHSTLGIVVTTDGTFTDIKRDDYLVKEEAVVNELKSINKPFIVVFNTKNPSDERVKKECENLQKKYGVSVVAMDVLNVKKEGLEFILSKVLEEFPITSIDFEIPKWIESLDVDSEILSYTLSAVKSATLDVTKMHDVDRLEGMFDDSNVYKPITKMDVNMATGRVKLYCEAKDGVFFKALCELTGEDLSTECALMDYVNDLTYAKKNYYKLKDAITDAEVNDYGIVPAQFTESNIGEPEVVKKAGQYCVKMRVDGQSLHIIRADLVADIETVYGSLDQCENFVRVMEKEGYNATVFGRSVNQIVAEELQKKCVQLPENMRTKLKRVITKSVNEKRSGFIYVLI